VFPEYEWLPWQFERSSRNYWNDMNNQRKFAEWAAKYFKIQQLSDWYKISYEVTIATRIKRILQDIRQVGAGTLLRRYGYSPIKFISQIFPQHHWEENFSNKSKKSQFLLKSMLKTIFPKEGKYLYALRIITCN
jgi:hypothetical protein